MILASETIILKPGFSTRLRFESDYVNGVSAPEHAFFVCLFTWSAGVTSEIEKSFMAGNYLETNCTQEFIANIYKILFIQTFLPRKIGVKEPFTKK